MHFGHENMLLRKIRPQHYIDYGKYFGGYITHSETTFLLVNNFDVLLDKQKAKIKSILSCCN